MTERNHEKRPRGILSEADREYLRGEKELSSGAERNARQRIRERVQAGISDFRNLWSLLPDRDLEQIFYPGGKERRQEIRSSTQQALAFLLLGLWTNRDPHEGRLENALEQAAFANDWLVNAEVEVTAEEAPSGNLLLAKMKDKEQRITELKQRIEDENLSEYKEADLRDKVRKEAALQYYLFEKGLSDPSVDAEEFSSLTMVGEEIMLEPEDVEKNHEVWQETPLARKTLPAIVDISYETESDMEEIIEAIEEEQGNEENRNRSEVEEE